MAEGVLLTAHGERVSLSSGGPLGSSNADPWKPLAIVVEADVMPVDTQLVQGEVEGAPLLDESNSIEFMGERFRLAENVGLMPLLRFANASKRGLDSDDFEGMAAMYAMIRGIIHRPPLLEPEKIEQPDGEWTVNPLAGKPQRDSGGQRLYDESEWQRFQEFAEAEGAEGDELMTLVGKAMGVIGARPRSRRAVSSSPSPATSPSSRESLSSPGTPARPDLDLSHLTQVSELGRST